MSTETDEIIKKGTAKMPMLEAVEFREYSNKTDSGTNALGVLFDTKKY